MYFCVDVYSYTHIFAHSYIAYVHLPTPSPPSVFPGCKLRAVDDLRLVHLVMYVLMCRCIFVYSYIRTFLYFKCVSTYTLPPFGIPRWPIARCERLTAGTLSDVCTSV